MTLDKANKSERHFLREKGHTRIKHSIFAETLKKSLSIANMLAGVPTFNKGKPQTFTYIDLFAGPGSFQDDKKGSPLLAFQIFKDHVASSSPVKNNFSKIQLIAIEKEETDASNLRSLLNIQLQASACQNNLEIRVESGDWEKQSAAIAILLSRSQWGFVFADPFSTELDIDKLIQTIKNGRDLKDILIFSNFQTLSRQAERQHRGDAERVCKSLGIEQLPQDEYFSDTFKNALQERFGNLKQFTIGVAIPVEVRKKLYSADYFYLVCATDSVKVADNFLEAYEKEAISIKENIAKTNQLSLGLDCDPLYCALDSSVISIIRKDFNGKATLYQIVMKCFNDFLSWKETINNPHYKVPTIRNVVDSVNSLKKSNRIVFSCRPQYLYKTARQNHQAGELKYLEIKNKQDAQAIGIRANPT